MSDEEYCRQRSTRSHAFFFMLFIALGAMFLLACNDVEVATPEQISQVEQRLCANYTYCVFYTDASLTTTCGEREMCILCGSTVTQFGCVDSPFRVCQIMEECALPPPEEL